MTISHLLDTNICIYIIKKSPVKAFKKLKTFDIGKIGISAITLLELQFGISKSSPAYIERNQDLLNQFLTPLEIFDYPQESSLLYGKTRTFLESKGTKIGSLDLLISVHALYLNATVVTNNIKEFSRVPDLKVENWV